MPTIEIISFNRKSLIRINRKKYSFAIRQNSTLESHRSLFDEYLSKYQGVILHLGNLSLAKESFFFAGDLIDWKFGETDTVHFPEIKPKMLYEEQWSGSDQLIRFKFIAEHIDGIKDLLEKSIKLSPIRKASFLTDYQFGPSGGQFISLSRIEEFWSIHDSEGLTWNTIYILEGSHPNT